MVGRRIFHDHIGEYACWGFLMKLMTKRQSLLLCAGCLVWLSLQSYGYSGGDSAKSSPAASESEEKNEAKSRSKKVYTNEDLKELKETVPINQAPEVTSESKGSESKASRKKIKTAGVDSYRDIHGHDRTYWQQKIRPLRKQLESLDSQVASLQSKQDKMNAASGIKVSRSGKLQASSSDTRAQLTKQIEGLNAKKAETLRSIQEVEEDARKAQALPEWLR
jgi:chromosome segregation ATPase